MRLKNLLSVGVVIFQFNLFASVLHAQSLLNIDFGVGTSSAKVGFAAVIGK